MSKPVEYIDSLYNNPFLFTPVFSDFYASLDWKPNNLLLGYLVLPLVLYPSSQLFLTRANKNSSIRTMLNDKARIYGLSQRVEEFKSVTNESIQYALDCGDLNLGEEVTLEPGETSMPPMLRQLSKPAIKLAMLFNPYDVPTVYRMLGVKKI